MASAQDLTTSAAALTQATTDLTTSVNALIAKPSAGIDPATLDPVNTSIQTVTTDLQNLKAAVDKAVAG